MGIPAKEWSLEDERDYQEQLIDIRLKEDIPDHRQAWFGKAKETRKYYADQCNRRSTDKTITERLHYKWLEFYYKTIRMAAEHDLTGREDRAAWLILLKEELNALEDWDPALSRAHTLRRHGFLGLRAEYIMLAKNLPGTEPIILNTKIDESKLEKHELQWKLLWEERKNRCSEEFPVLSKEEVEGYRRRVVKETYRLTYEAYPAFTDGQLKTRHPSLGPQKW